MELTRFPGLLVCLFLLSAFGWSRLGRFFCDRRLFRFHILSVIFGLALLNVAGGVLNFLGLARPMMFLALMLGGALLAVFELLKTKPWRNYRFRPAQIPVWVAAGCAATACFLLVPTKVFNIGDDFQTYVVRAMRMTQTGTLGGNVFDSLGLDSLGSQSFFHGFFLAGNDITLLNGFDAVACFAICLLLAAELSVRWRLSWVAGTLAVLCVVFINPQCVNISPLYSGAVAIMAVVICGLLSARGLTAPPTRNQWRADLSLALIVAWLLTLKVTLAMFGVLFVSLLYLFLLATGHSRRETLKSLFRVGGVAGLLVLPWIFLFLPALLKARGLGLGLQSNAALATKYPSLSAHNIAGLFSTFPSFYGNSPSAFLALAAACLIMGGVGLAVWLKSGKKKVPAAGATVAAAGLVVPVAVLANGHLFPMDTAIRYACPVLIGAFVAIALCSLRLAKAYGAGRAKSAGLLVSGFMLGALLLFSGTFWTRAQSVAANRTLLAFPTDPTYQKYSRAMVSPFEAEYAGSIQTNTPAGATILVWTVAQFQLDFSRNQLLSVSESGIINPALRFPAGADLKSFGNYLRANGVRYVLIETNGYGVTKLDRLQRMTESQYAVYQKLGAFGAYLRQTLLTLAQQNPVLFADEQMLLFELKDSPAPDQSQPALPNPTTNSPDGGKIH
ncbi:MAG: hypothetical protein JWR19_1031 [Pedosphaera sp.]|nr:hypothetical protein [Pedosphaera sp.]